MEILTNIWINLLCNCITICCGYYIYQGGQKKLGGIFMLLGIGLLTAKIILMSIGG